MTDKFAAKPGDTELLEKYLQGDTDISQLYQLSKTERAPQQMTDDLLASIINGTKNCDSSAVSKPFISNWQMPFSLASIIVLSFSVFLIGKSQPELQELEPAISEKKTCIRFYRAEYD